MQEIRWLGSAAPSPQPLSREGRGAMSAVLQARAHAIRTRMKHTKCPPQTAANYGPARPRFSSLGLCNTRSMSATKREITETNHG